MRRCWRRSKAEARQRPSIHPSVGWYREPLPVTRDDHRPSIFHLDIVDIALVALVVVAAGHEMGKNQLLHARYPGDARDVLRRHMLYIHMPHQTVAIRSRQGHMVEGTLGRGAIHDLADEQIRAFRQRRQVGRWTGVPAIDDGMVADLSAKSIGKNRR